MTKISGKIYEIYTPETVFIHNVYTTGRDTELKSDRISTGKMNHEKYTTNSLETDGFPVLL